MLPFLIGAGIATAVGALTVRERRTIRANRRDLLAKCASLLDDGKIDIATAEFPKLTGHLDGRPVHAELMPDTMTIRRLPQLWLSVTMLDKLPIKGGYAVLVRPSGNDYYSLTENFSHTLDPPREFPWEVLVRGASPYDQRHVTEMAQVVGRILADPKVKEVAVTPKGVRIVRQAGEGRRGEHLLLRQAIFDEAQVPAVDFRTLLEQLDDVRSGVHQLFSAERAA